jgi:uncharacterized membrane-anchored protein YhcB (DUF1043 family)
MDAWHEPFTTPPRLPSLATVVGILAIGRVLLRMVPRKVDESKPPAG